MSRDKLNRKTGLFLFLILILCVAGTIILKRYFIIYEKSADFELLKKSSNLTQNWFDIIGRKKSELKIFSDSGSLVPNSFLIGDDYSFLTTTLGSLEAKELSTNPVFSAAILKMLLATGINSNSTIGITISGSFPALAVATLAACQTIGSKVILFSSVGSSSFGANQPTATWLDYERWLIEEGSLNYSSDIVTPGAENDMGEGLPEESDSLMNNAAERNGYSIFHPSSLVQSIKVKSEFLLKNKIELLINIGGNHAAVGGCSHAVSIPNGLNKPRLICGDENRGIISILAEKGIPFIHLLNIKDLSVKTGIPLEPGIVYGDSTPVFYSRTINKIAVAIFLSVIIAFLFLLKFYTHNLRKHND